MVDIYIAHFHLQYFAKALHTMIITHKACAILHGYSFPISTQKHTVSPGVRLFYMRLGTIIHSTRSPISRYPNDLLDEVECVARGNKPLKKSDLSKYSKINVTKLSLT